MSLKSPLVPLTVILLSFGQLIVNGWNATSTIAENLPNPRGQDAVNGIRIVDLVHQTPNLGRIYDLVFERPAMGPTVVHGNTHLKVQLSSNGRTRILIIRPGSPTPLRKSALFDLLRGKARFQIVADRKWVDLGPLPEGGQPLRIQVTGLLPGSFGFAELNKPANPVFSGIQIVRRQQPEAPALTTYPRYRLTIPAPVTAKETLARFFFFISISRVLQVAGVLALVLLFTGWWLLGKERITAAVCCLIPSVVLLHAACLPPLQGADETGHGATIERMVYPNEHLQWFEYPLSFSLAAEALQQDRAQFHPDEPLPLNGGADRTRLQSVFEAGLQEEARRAAPPPVVAYMQPIDARAPLFYRPWTILAPFLQGRVLVDRLSLYRLLSALSGLGLFCAGAVLLHRGAVGPLAVLLYGVVWLVPYMVITMASISNYATAIGFGSLLTACVLALVLSEQESLRRVAAGILVFGSWVGIPVWSDFIFFAPVVTAVVLMWLVAGVTVRWDSTPRRLVRALAGSLIVLALGFLILKLPGVKTGNIGTRMPMALPAPDDPVASEVAVVVALPLLITIIAALGILPLDRLPEAKRRTWAPLVFFVLATILVLGFLLTPYTMVPYENVRLPFADFAMAHIRSFISTAFGWDQDPLSWKFYVGVAGWHDVFYPDWFYAVAKWALVLFLICLPPCLVCSAEKTPKVTATLLLVAGFGASLSIATLTIRYFQPGNPWGRFMLPWLPLVLTPVLIPFLPERWSRAVRVAFRLGVLVQIWAPVALVGTRYLFGQS